MPPLPIEDPGPPPVSGLVWVGGSFTWSGATWEWTAGRWMGAANAGFTVELGAGERVPVAYQPPTPPPGYVPPPPPPSYVPPTRPPVRDHRTPAVAPVAPPPAVPTVPAPTPPARPKTRDHRDGH